MLEELELPGRPIMNTPMSDQAVHVGYMYMDVAYLTVGTNYDRQEIYLASYSPRKPIILRHTLLTLLCTSCSI